MIAWRSTQLIVVEVFPSSNRPHHLRNLGPEDGVFVRLGSTNRKADPALLQELRRMAANETFDEATLPELDSEALDFRAAAESFPGRGHSSRADWQTLRLLAPCGRRLVPTTGGLLLFGRKPESRFPDAWIAAAIHLTSRAVRTRMSTLVEQGLVTVVGKNPRDPQRRYFWRPR